jgi:hypothetical protein
MIEDFHHDQATPRDPEAVTMYSQRGAAACWLSHVVSYESFGSGRRNGFGQVQAAEETSASAEGESPQFRSVPLERSAL